MSKKNTETTTKEVEIEKNESDEVEFGLVSEKPSKFKQAGAWALVVGGITVIGVATAIAATAVLNRLVNHTENGSDDYYDEETDTYVEVNTTENETSEE